MGDLCTPAWVVNVREEIGRSPAWEVLSDQVYARVSIILKSHGLGHFSDLSSPEQITLLEEAHRDIMSEDNKVYQAFESQFSKSMDAEIAKEARARVDKYEAAKHGHTDEALYLDSILDSAAQGAVSLLRELPREHLGSLRLMLNQAVPSRARLDIWRLLLKHTPVREEYELLMKQNRNSTISGQDIYITHRCQALLESGSVAARRLLPLTSRNVVLMKTVLSYHHACKMNKRGEKATVDVPDSFLHFLVPLCAVATRGAAFSSASSGASSGGHNAATAAGATVTAATAASSTEQKIEVMIEDLVEMFEAALEAGLEGLVDPRELGDNDRGGAVGSGGAVPTRTKKPAKELKTSSATEGGDDGGNGDGDKGNGDPPAWVDKIFGVLVPGFQGLVDHVTRVHLGLAVAAEADGVEDKREGGTGNDDTHAEASTAALETLHQQQEGGEQQHQQPQQQEKLEGDNTTDTQQRRRASSTTRREAVLSRAQEKPSSAENDPGSSSVGDGNGAAVASDTLGGGEEKSGVEATTRRRSSLPPEGEGPDDKDKPSLNRHDTTTETPPLPKVSESQARSALHALCLPLVRVGLVGHLGADATLFAWDQAVITGFGVMMPRVAAMVVAAAAEKLEACATFVVMSEALFSHAHLVSISQLQELMEVHCMPSIRKEMRVSHKLSPEIVGPTLQTATQILDSAYSKKTREKQQARKAHVDHILGPSKGFPSKHAERKGLQLDLTGTPADNSGGSTGGGAIRHPEQDDDDDDDFAGDFDDSSDDHGSGPRVSGAKRVEKGTGERKQGHEVSKDANKKPSKRGGVEHRRNKLSALAAVDTDDTANVTGGHDDDARGKTSGKAKSGKRPGGTDPDTAAAVPAEGSTPDVVVSASKKAGRKRVEDKSRASNLENEQTTTIRRSSSNETFADSGSDDDGPRRDDQHRNSRRRLSAESSRGSRRRSSSLARRRQQPKSSTASSEHNSQGRHSPPHALDSGRRADGEEGSVARSSVGEHGRGDGRRGSRPRQKGLTENNTSFDESSGTGEGQAGIGAGRERVGGGDKKVAAAERARATERSAKQDGSKSSGGSRRKRSSHSKDDQGKRDKEASEKSKEGAGKTSKVKPKRKDREGGKSKKGKTPSAAPPNAAEAGAAAPAASVSPLRRLMGAFGGTKKAQPTTEA